MLNLLGLFGEEILRIQEIHDSKTTQRANSSPNSLRNTDFHSYPSTLLAGRGRGNIHEYKKMYIFQMITNYVKRQDFEVIAPPPLALFKSGRLLWLV